MCEKTRRQITENEFRFDVKTNFATENLGLKKRFSTGLEWIFEQSSEAIILEDDTVPSISFFKLCDILLEYFRGDNRVWDISGSNYLDTWKRNGYDYHFSLYGGIWGWATWRESWEEYDKTMERWNEEIIKSRVRDVINDADQYRYLKRVYDKTESGELDTWDYQWGFARHRNNALSVVPSKNLVENIGFDETATNTTNPSHGFANKDTYEMSFPLNHPPFVAPDREYDQRFHELRQTRSKPRRLLDAMATRLGL
ncbi:Glycosyl transferase family 2 [Halorhabdus sp. BNX81]|nr:Glycosyl transferase family 2 [Halorhabdus sp. BNX81]